MFTGLIETVGTIVGRRRSGGAGKLSVRPRRPFDAPVPGESVAVNGCCLTLETADGDGTLHFHTLEETLHRTNLGVLPTGAAVNLERALRLGDRLGGHLVSGHIDAVGRLAGVNRRGDDIEYRVELPSELKPFLVEKGSIAIDGVSLTLVELTDRTFTVHLIPVTLQETALELRPAGAPLNLESDMLGKYVRRQLQLGECGAASGRTVTMETLYEAGFR